MMPADAGSVVEFSSLSSRFVPLLQMSRLFPGSSLAFLLLFLALLSGCEQPPLLERIEERGILRIATVAGPLTCYLDEKGPAGLEYELARRFAHTLAAKADFRLYPTRLAALEALKRGEVQMVAAARQPSSLDRERYRLSAPWYSTPLGFASTMGKLPLKSLTKPPEEPVAVPSGSLQQELLQSMAPTLPVEMLANHAEETILDEVNGGPGQPGAAAGLEILLPFAGRRQEALRTPGISLVLFQAP